jgi:hypothetical protein
LTSSIIFAWRKETRHGVDSVACGSWGGFLAAVTVTFDALDLSGRVEGEWKLTVGEK